MAVTISVVLLALCLLRAPMAARTGSAQVRLLLRLLLGAVSVGVAAAALWGQIEGASALLGGLWMVGGLVASVAPDSRRGPRGDLSWLGWALGPLMGALVLGERAETVIQGNVLDDTHAGLILATGVMLALAAAFTLRATTRLGRVLLDGKAGFVASLWGVWILAALAMRILSAPGLKPGQVHFPALGADGHVPVWLTNVAEGFPLVLVSKDSGTIALVIGAGAILALVGSLIPGKGRGLASVLSGLALLVSAGMLVAKGGTAVTPDPESIKAMLEAMGADPALVQQPRLLGNAPFAVSVHLMGIPMALLVSAGLGALGAGAARLMDQDTEGEDAWDDIVHRLAARDAAQVAVVCVWLGLAALLLAGRHVTGIWGPVSPAEHLMTGAALASTASLLALYGVGSGGRLPHRLVRAMALGLLLGAVVAAGAGGLVSGAGVFGL